MRAWIVALSLLLGGCGALARGDNFRRFHFGAAVDMSARWAASDAKLTSDELIQQGTVGLAGRAMGGTGRYKQLAIGTDVELGAERPGAFVYGFHLMPLGLGMRLGKSGFAGVIGGVGFGGVTGRVPFGGEFPVETFVELDLGPQVRLVTGARATWVTGADSRQDGAELWDGADQLDLRAGFAFGKREDEGFGAWSDRNYVGVSWREQSGERFVGIVVALALSGAGGDDGPQRYRGPE